MIGLGAEATAVGAWDSLTLATLDASGSKDILVNLGELGFKVFRRPRQVRPGLSRP